MASTDSQTMWVIVAAAGFVLLLFFIAAGSSDYPSSRRRKRVFLMTTVKKVDNTSVTLKGTDPITKRSVSLTRKKSPYKRYRVGSRVRIPVDIHYAPTKVDYRGYRKVW
jgi:hypothetical protein